MGKGQRLTPIPKQKHKPAVPQADRDGSGFNAVPEGPDLSHIAPGLLKPEVVALADLAFMTGNAWRHPEKQVGEIAGSIRQFTQVEALVVNRREKPAQVIGGNGRLAAMLQAGYSHAAVVFVDLPPEKAKLLSIALNKSADGRELDAEAMGKLLESVQADDAAARLLEDPGLAAMLQDLEKELAPREKPKDDAAGDTTPEPGPEPKLGVVVECRDAEHQQAVMLQLTAAGEACRALTFTEQVRLALAK